MQMGMIGLGRMGANMTKRLLQGGHTIVVTDLNKDAVAAAAKDGAVAATSMTDLASKMTAPTTPAMIGSSRSPISMKSSQSKTHPPITPPPRPTTVLPIKPKPLPFMICAASKPTTAPTIRQMMKSRVVKNSIARRRGYSPQQNGERRT